jgi:hypothetical protein
MGIEGDRNCAIAFFLLGWPFGGKRALGPLASL